VTQREVMTWDDLGTGARELAETVAADGWVPDMILGIARGGLLVAGAIEVEPNATNVVPERVTVAVDARSADAELLDRLIEAIGFEVGWRSDPVPMGDAFAAVLPGVPRLVSGAGHDAMFVPNASMLFVRSLNGGVSHHPDELSSQADIGLAIDALTAALDRLTA
jgi:acetylornithine deacetylase/succinyl-diaminopimelate desuccinylase-like protein